VLDVFPAVWAPLAEVSPAPLGTALPVPPGAIGSAFAAPDDVEELLAPVPCAEAGVDAKTARQQIKGRTVRFNIIVFSFDKRM
jgi:hypothetical protein